MSEITLHFRVEGQSACAVCGANIDRPAGAWWLRNTWTVHRSHYVAGETSLPGEFSRPCGSLLRLQDDKTPNAEFSGPPAWR